VVIFLPYGNSHQGGCIECNDIAMHGLYNHIKIKNVLHCTQNICFWISRANCRDWSEAQEWPGEWAEAMGLGSSTLWLSSSILWTFLGSQLLSSPLCWSIWQVSLSSYVRGNFYPDSLSTLSASKLMGQDSCIKGQFVGVNCGQCVVVKVLSVWSWS
jgi:hypothetical protein